MKKTIFTLTMCLIAVLGFSQTDTDTLGSSHYAWYPVDTKTWVLTIPVDTVTSDNDTLFIGSDTILTVRDTGVIVFPHKFGTPFSGDITMLSDSIVGAIQGDVSFALYQADCESCPYYAITGATANHTTPPDDSQKYFQLRGLKLELKYWRVGTGTSQIHGWIILKPSSISNNASN